MNILAIIPMRGGSKGIPRKNIRFLNGKPLMNYIIDTVKNSKMAIDICVSTDDEEISAISKIMKVPVIQRDSYLATDNITLDPVIYDALVKMEEQTSKIYDVVITLQATSPLLKTKTLDNAIDYFLNSNKDTVISVENKPHLFWKKNKNEEIVEGYIERQNRQYLPSHYMETGAFMISKRKFVTKKSRFGNAVGVYEVPDSEAIDIDNPQDWWVADKLLKQKNILIRVEGYSIIGLGHVYRALSLAYSLIDHKIHFIISKKSDLAIDKIEKSHFNYTIINDDEDLYDFIKNNNVDIIINDILNTTENYVKKLNELHIRVVNFEDLGEGAPYADAVINDLYAPQNDYNNFYWGSEYFLIRDEFLLSSPANFNEQVKNVLVIFGGVDPKNFLQKCLEAISLLDNKSDISFTMIAGPGYEKIEELKQNADRLRLKVEILQDVKLMTEEMKKADLAISSQGRTMLELASMQVPTIILAQHERELTHEFGYMPNGFINLGLGEKLDSATLAKTIDWLINSPQIRNQMYTTMSSKNFKDGLQRVLKIILG